MIESKVKQVTFEVLKVTDLRKNMRISFHMDTGTYYGTIMSVGPSVKRKKITIMVKDIVTDPEEKQYFSLDTVMQFDVDENKSMKVRVPS